uniref:Uncharacterized protein n=1 Tax=Megaselia scalaris TaxID=36166 RepID=T1GLC0_MEGSC
MPGMSTVCKLRNLQANAGKHIPFHQRVPETAASGSMLQFHQNCDGTCLLRSSTKAEFHFNKSSPEERQMFRWTSQISNDSSKNYTNGNRLEHQHKIF